MKRLMEYIVQRHFQPGVYNTFTILPGSVFLTALSFRIRALPGLARLSFPQRKWYSSGA
jgi:hypothetical protein